MSDETEPDPQGPPAPTLSELMAERRELFEAIIDKSSTVSDQERMLLAYFRLNFTIDELLVTEVTSIRDVQKFAATQYGELRAQVEDLAEAQP